MEDSQTNGQEVTVQPIENIVQIDDGKMFTTSLIVAEAFEKNHYDVLKAISNLECSPEFNERNFTAVEYKDAKGEMRPAYRLSRDGFAFLAMGFTGKKAAAWKEKFLEAFNAMEAALRRPALPFDKPSREDDDTLKQRVIKAVRGLAAYWAFVEKIPLAVAEFCVCSKFGLTRLDEITSDDYIKLFKYTRFVTQHPTSGHDSKAATSEQIILLNAMLTACSQLKYTRDLDFEEDFESLTGVKVKDVPLLSSHDAEKCFLSRGACYTAYSSEPQIGIGFLK